MTITILLTILILTQATVMGIIILIGIKLRNRFQHQQIQYDLLYQQIQPLKLTITRQTDNLCSEIQNAISLNQIGMTFPVFFGDYSMDSFLGKYLVHKLVEIRPRTVLELGSGSSTIIIAKSMQKMGYFDYRHYSIDHDKCYMQYTSDIARLNQVDSRVTFLHCPLEYFENIGKKWYSGLPEKMQGEKLDFVLVDGPPGNIQLEARYPALPILYPFLNDKCLLILDDANREDEKAICEKWRVGYPEFEVCYYEYGHGFAVLSRGFKRI